MSERESAVSWDVSRWLASRLLVVALFTAVLGGGGIGCRADAVPAEALATTTQAITTPRELRLALPAGTKLHDIAVGASGSLQIGSNTSLRSETGFATAGSSGAGDTALATDAAVGNLFSQGPVRLGTRARVNGDLKTAASSKKAVRRSPGPSRLERR